MKVRRLEKAGIIGLLVIGFSALVWADEVSLRGDTLNECILEIRPLRPRGLTEPIMQESQVYWDEYKDPAAKHYGTLLKIEVPKDALVLFGDVDATSASIISLKASESYVVRLYWNNTLGSEGAFYEVSIDGGGTFGTPIATRHEGHFDELGKYSPPETQGVHRQVAGDKRRIRLWGKNRGVSTAITLSDV